jgi:hypothetical protein
MRAGIGWTMALGALMLAGGAAAQAPLDGAALRGAERGCRSDRDGAACRAAGAHFLATDGADAGRSARRYLRRGCELRDAVSCRLLSEALIEGRPAQGIGVDRATALLAGRHGCRAGDTASCALVERIRNPSLAPPDDAPAPDPEPAVDEAAPPAPPPPGPALGFEEFKTLFFSFGSQLTAAALSRRCEELGSQVRGGADADGSVFRRCALSRTVDGTPSLLEVGLVLDGGRVERVSVRARLATDPRDRLSLLSQVAFGLQPSPAASGEERYTAVGVALRVGPSSVQLDYDPGGA